MFLKLTIIQKSIYQLTSNSHGDTILLTGSKEKITLDYDAFGNYRSTIESMTYLPYETEEDERRNIENFYKTSNGIKVVNLNTYAGETYDTESGLFYLRARQYNPETGRFTRKDTYEGDEGNLFEYCESNPCTHVDPSGQFLLVGALIAGAVTGVITGVVTGDWKKGLVAGIATTASVATCGLATAALGATATTFGGAVLLGAIGGASYSATEIVADHCINGTEYTAEEVFGKVVLSTLAGAAAGGATQVVSKAAVDLIKKIPGVEKAANFVKNCKLTQKVKQLANKVVDAVDNKSKIGSVLKSLEDKAVNALEKPLQSAANAINNGAGKMVSATKGLLKKAFKTSLNSLDDIFTQGKKVFDNFDVETAYVKPKHLSMTGGNGQKFIGASKAETESILKDVLSNGTITSITDNGLTKAGNASYEIIIDAGKVIGTKGEKMVKIVLSSDGGMLSAYPIK